MTHALDVLSFADPPDGRPLIAGMHSRETPVVGERHSHPHGQLAGWWRGLLTVRTEAGNWVVPAVHAVWIPPNHPHSGRSHGPFDGWVVLIRPSACNDLPARPVTLRTSGLLREAVLRIAQWRDQPVDETHLALSHVILNEIRTLPVENMGLRMPSDVRLTRIAGALMSNLADDRDFKAWAAWAGVSARTLSRRFVAETGFTFTEWRQRARLLRSLEMLAEGLPVTTIALDLGYNSISAFIALFRRTFGVTPGEYIRNSARQSLEIDARGLSSADEPLRGG